MKKKTDVVCRSRTRTLTLLFCPWPYAPSTTAASTFRRVAEERESCRNADVGNASPSVSIVECQA